MKQLLFILALLIGTCFATHAKTIDADGTA